MTRPSVATVGAAFDSLFVMDEETFIIRRSQVSRAVAAALGLPWSPALGRVCYAVAREFGARPAVVRVPVYARLRPRHIDRDTALRRSDRLREEARREPANDESLRREVSEWKWMRK